MAVLAVTVMGLIAGTASSADPHERYILTLQGPPARARQAVATAVERSGGKVLRAFSLIPAVVIELPAPALQGLIRNPNLQGVIRLAEKDAIVTASKKPTNPGSGKPPKDPPPPPPPQVTEWGVDWIDAEKAWATATGDGVKVCIIDTGISKNHPDLQANIKGGINFVRQKGKIRANAWDDDNGHGSHVAGIVAALDNEIGVVGVAPKASLYAAKALDKAGSGYISDIIAAIEWAVANKMQVVNMSLGTPSDIAALRNACASATAQGVLLIAAAGNSGDGSADTNEVEYPGAYPSTIAVSATYPNDTVTSWSSSGPEVDLAAPGSGIRSTSKGSDYDTKSGTSMAAPHVAGTAALVLSVTPAISVANLRARLANTADDIAAPGVDKVSGAGLVDAEESTTGTQSVPQ
jgi:subtilisin